MRLHRSAFAPAALAILACAAAVVRWYVQGSRNIYTALDKRFYVPDADLGWRVGSDHPIWLGLDVCAVIAAIAIGLAVVGFLIRSRRAMVLRVASWVFAAAPLCLAVAAFATGSRPANARDTLPATAAVLVESGISGSLDAPAGHYVVVPHAGTSLTAHLSSGGETFDARFDHDITGSWDGDPRDPSHAMHARIHVAAASVDTGIRERTKHAREGYLHADEFPAIEFSIDHVIAVRSDRPGLFAFRAAGTVQLMGKSHAVEASGTLEKPDAAALGRLGLTGDILLVQADFALVIKATALAAKAGDFDGDRIPIHASLVLRLDRD